MDCAKVELACKLNVQLHVQCVEYCTYLNLHKDSWLEVYAEIKNLLRT